MNPSYPIQPEVASRAARDYLTICQAGRLEELEREVGQAIGARVASGEHIDLGRAWQCQQARSWADRLARMLDCEPFEVDPYIVPTLIDGPTRRAIVLESLRTVANAARRQAAPIAGRARS